MRSLPKASVRRIVLPLLFVIITGAVAVVGSTLLKRQPHAATAPRRATHTAQSLRPSTRAPSTGVIALPRESQFALEQRMTPSQLMNRWSPLIAQASRRFNVPAAWIRAVMVAESGGRTLAGENRALVSNAGALGLMQLMPRTYATMRARYSLGPDPQDPHDNIFAGAALLRALYLRYGYPGLFSAYNDGPGNVDARLAGGGLLPSETMRYSGGITHALDTGIGLHGVKVKFTRPNGQPIWLDSSAIVSVRAALPGEYAPGVQTVVMSGRMHQGVRESVARVRKILHIHAGG